MRNLVMALIMIWIVIAGMSVATWSLAAEVKPCAPALSLLDTEVLTTLNQLATLIVEHRRGDNSTGLGVTSLQVLQGKLQELEIHFPTHETRDAITKYLNEEVRHLEQVQNAKISADAKTEDLAREDEHQLFVNYDLISEASDLNSTDTDIANDGETVTMGEPYKKRGGPTSNVVDRLIFEDLALNYRKTLTLSKGITLPKEIFYYPSRGEVYITTASEFYAVSVPKDFTDQMKATPERLFSIFPHSPDSSVKLKQAYALAGQTFDSGLTGAGSLFVKTQASRNAEVFATSEHGQIVVFRPEDKTFTVMKIPSPKNPDFREGEWALSPDGKYIAVGTENKDAWPLYIFSTKTGDIVKTLHFKTSSVGFSNDGQWIATNDGPNTCVIKNIWDDQVSEKRSHDGSREGLFPRKGFIDKFVFSPDDRHLFTFTPKFLGVFDAGTGALHQKIPNRSSPYKGIKFMEDGRTILLFDQASGTSIRQLK